MDLEFEDIAKHSHDRKLNPEKYPYAEGISL